jgi:23S rRNA (pseudouridine1915-N3)-methyltransferase
LKLRLVCVGKVSEAYLREGIGGYASRIKRYLPFETIEIKEERAGTKSADYRFVRDREGERILGKISPPTFVVTLDERGGNLSSQGLADLLEQHMIRGTSEFAMVVGGPYGLGEAVKNRSNFQLSISSMTFTHQMVRLILLEQVYRALTIIRHEPYHNP